MSDQTTLKEYGRQKRQATKAAEIKKKERVSPIPSIASATDDDDSVPIDLHILRNFDLDYSYGPAIGITRLDRWKRAYKLGLDPDPKVEHLILEHNDDSKYTQCVWSKTIVDST